MDKNRFDGFTRQLAKRENRRQAIKTLFAGGVGAAAVAGGETSAARPDCCPADHPTLCGLTCTDTISSTQNCGGCGITCEADERCYKSVCESTSVVHCAAVSDCPVSDTECATPTCKKGICGVSYAASGKKTAAQTAGDCQRNVCDGAGNIITINDNTDKPAAQGECWTGICVDGVPHQNARPFGRNCSTGKCDGAGVCSGGGCTSASSCPGTDSECATVTCTNGVCGMSSAPFGTATANQTAGDCKKNVCDGAGGATTVNDDTDVINTHYPEECVETACSNGTTVTQNKPYASRCGPGFCDGAGICLSCLVDGDCPDSGLPNAVTICAGGYCSYQCITGYTDCPNGAGCIDTSIDINHCGGCNHPCSVNNGMGVCNNGTCGIGACNQGFLDCNGIATDGCEVNVSIDSSNCGVCGNPCGPGTSCANGTCQ